MATTGVTTVVVKFESSIRFLLHIVMKHLREMCYKGILKIVGVLHTFSRARTIDFVSLIQGPNTIIPVTQYNGDVI